MLRLFISAPKRQRKQYIQEYARSEKAVKQGLAPMSLLRMKGETHPYDILALEAHLFSARGVPPGKGKEYVLSK